MEEPPEGMQLCPTRPEGPVPLFAHAITLAQCEARQAANYHKCANCAHAHLAAKTLVPQPRPLTHPNGAVSVRRVERR